MNDLERHTLRLIGENIDSPDVFTDDADGMQFIRDCINDALQEVCALTKSYQRTYYLTLLEDRQFYRLSPQADFVAYPVDVFDRENKRRLMQTDAKSLSMQDPNWMTSTGPIEWYMLIGQDVFGVYRIPSAKGLVLELNCACIPRPYTDDTLPVKLRASFQRACVYRAVSEFFASRGDAKRAVEYWDRYLDVSGLMSLNPQMADRQYQFGGFNPYQAATNGGGT